MISGGVFAANRANRREWRLTQWPAGNGAVLMPDTFVDAGVQQPQEVLQVAALRDL